MRRLLVVALGAGAVLATTFATTPASATCMSLFNIGDVVYSYSCAPPGGPVTTYYCVHDHCWSHTSGGGGGGDY